jgi:2-methylaconitate cis-trans-isomerase PrpF
VTQLDTPTPNPVDFDSDLSFVTNDSMSISGGEDQQELEKEQQRLAWVSGRARSMRGEKCGLNCEIGRTHLHKITVIRLSEPDAPIPLFAGEEWFCC